MECVVIGLASLAATRLLLMIVFPYYNACDAVPAISAWRIAFRMAKLAPHLERRTATKMLMSNL